MTCRLYVSGEGERIITGDLLDPAAEEHPNIYTESLGKKIKIVAKPTFKDGQLYRLAVNDAKPMSD